MKRLTVTLALLLVLDASLLAQDSLSAQVLQLLTRLNNWVVLQTYWAGLRLVDGVPSDTSGVLYRSGNNLYWNGAQVAGSGSATAPHTLLGTTHSDTALDTVTRGSLIIGNSTPAWDELIIGAANTWLKSDGSDAGWSSDLTGATNIPASGLVGVLPALNGGSLTNLNASNLAAGTVPLARLSGITNTQIDAAAAIAYSKLALAGAINLSTDTAATALPFAKGGTGLTTAADDTTLVSSGSAWVASALPDCDAASSALRYDVTTNAFSCGTVSTATGTVSSVALSLPAIFSVTGSPVTTSGTLTGSLATQTANTVWAGPASAGPTAPTFRALVNADLPLSGASAGTVSGFTINTRGVITAAAALAAGDLPTVTVAKGGTALTSIGDDNVLVGSGATAMVATALPSCVGGALGYNTATNAFSCLASAATDSSTNTFTNKTLNAESTGNVLTTVERYWFDGAICNNATAVLQWSTPTSDPGVAACVTGSNTQKGVVDFADGAAVLSIQKQWHLPSDWTGVVDVQIIWYTSATAGSVVWQVATTCVADAETGDPAFNTASTVTDAAKGTTNQYNDATINSLTTTGCAVNETLYLKVLRDPAHGSDTLAATARLVGIELAYRRAQ